VLIGGAGNDALVGGAGIDTASFSDSAKTVTASLVTGKATGMGTDSMATIENLIGGAGNDVLTGSTEANRIDGAGGKDKLLGGAGSDVLVGGLGDDELIGGDDIDTADFSAGISAVRANLATGKASGWAGNDKLSTIEGLIGGSAADLLIGNDADNRLVGNSGDDNISGADGNDVLDGGYGNDLLVGGNGVDEVSYAGSMMAVNASLTANAATGMGSDTINGAENLTGGDGADVLIGNGSDNKILGGGGNDLLLGMAGSDALFGGAGNDRLDGGDDIDATDGEAGRNICRTSALAGDVFTNCPFSVAFDVTEARYVTGTFTDASGAGVGLTSVTLATKQGASVASTNTDIRGNFSFVAQTGNYDLTFETGSDKSLDGLPSMFKVVADVRVSVDTALAIKTPAALKLLASVFDANGDPVEGAALYTDYFYSSGTWQVAAGTNGLVSTQLGGAAAVTNANGQVELAVFATAPNNPMTLRAVWIDAQQQAHEGFVLISVVTDRSVSIDLG
jgi:Ca2+-binding RTX toxin-like protein